MKKQEIKVAVNSGKEALQLKHMLEIFKEPIDHNYFSFYSESTMYLIFSKNDSEWLIVNKFHPLFEREELTSISVIDLINMIMNPSREAAEILFTTEDGVPLCSRDAFYLCRWENNKGKWNDPLMKALNPGMLDTILKSSDEIKIFHNYQNAIEWVKKQNEPEEIRFTYDDTCGAKVTQEGVQISVYSPKGVCFFLDTDKLSEIYKANQSLQKF